jgi:urease subunit gamma/beta
MHLTPTEEDRLRVFSAAELARRTMARGLRLNVPEATALICDEIHMAARAGASFEDALEAGRRAVAADQLIPGVAELIEEVRVEVLLDEGSRLVVLRRPWG